MSESLKMAIKRAFFSFHFCTYSYKWPVISSKHNKTSRETKSNLNHKVQQVHFLYFLNSSHARLTDPRKNNYKDKLKCKEISHSTTKNRKNPATQQAKTSQKQNPTTQILQKLQERKKKMRWTSTLWSTLARQFFFLSSFASDRSHAREGPVMLESDFNKFNQLNFVICQWSIKKGNWKRLGLWKRVNETSPGPIPWFKLLMHPPTPRKKKPHTLTHYILAINNSGTWE